MDFNELAEAKYKELEKESAEISKETKKRKADIDAEMKEKNLK